MTFVLTEEQQMLKDAASDYTSEKLAVSHFRKLRDDGRNGVDPESWSQMAQMGWAGILIPEEHGGSGFGHVGLGQILEAQGRTVAATPLLQTALIGASAIMKAGDSGQQAEFLPRIADGSLTFALALDEGPHHASLQTALVARKEGEGFVISGHKRFVPNGHFADMFIVVARTSGEPGDARGLTLFLVPSDTDGLEITPLDTIDAHGAANLELSDVSVGGGAVLGVRRWRMGKP